MLKRGKKKKAISVTVSTFDSEKLSLNVSGKTTGHELLHRAAKELDISHRDSSFLGLSLDHEIGGWLAPDQRLDKCKARKFHLRFKFFPDRPLDELETEIARKTLHQQLRVESNGLFSNGDSSSSSEDGAFDFEPSVDEFLRDVVSHPLYGVTTFQAFNSKGTPIVIGVSKTGLAVYDSKDEQNAKAVFEWRDMAKISQRNSQFIVKFKDSTVKDFTASAAKGRTQKTMLNLLELAVEYHRRYVMQNDIVK